MIAEVSSAQWGTQVGAIFAGGGAVQLLLYLLKRRGELRALDRTSAGPLLEQQGAFIDRLQKAELKAQAVAAELEAKRQEEQAEFMRSLNNAHAESRRLSADVVRLRTDLEIARGQVEQLERQVRALRTQ